MSSDICGRFGVKGCSVLTNDVYCIGGEWLWMSKFGNCPSVWIFAFPGITT